MSLDSVFAPNTQIKSNHVLLTERQDKLRFHGAMDKLNNFIIKLTLNWYQLYLIFGQLWNEKPFKIHYATNCSYAIKTTLCLQICHQTAVMFKNEVIPWNWRYKENHVVKFHLQFTKCFHIVPVTICISFRDYMCNFRSANKSTCRFITLYVILDLLIMSCLCACFFILIILCVI